MPKNQPKYVEKCTSITFPDQEVPVTRMGDQKFGLYLGKLA